MLVQDRVDEWVSRIEKLPSETLLFGIEIVQTLSAVVVFFLFVIVWDTLPSLPPIKNDTTSVQFVSRHGEALFIIREELFVVKSSNYTVDRRLVAKDLEVAVAPTSAELKTGLYRKLSYVPHLDPQRVWCLHRTVSWTPGLSIRKHSYELDPICTKE